jgi:hypothetical protein
VNDVAASREFAELVGKRSQPGEERLGLDRRDTGVSDGGEHARRVSLGGLGDRLGEEVWRLGTFGKAACTDDDTASDAPVKPFLDGTDPPCAHDPQQAGADEHVNVVCDGRLWATERRRELGNGCRAFEHEVKQLAANRVSYRADSLGCVGVNDVVEVIVRGHGDKNSLLRPNVR